jgi:cytosine/adenosine deaminase-related metal-dependent hydrolase
MTSPPRVLLISGATILTMDEDHRVFDGHLLVRGARIDAIVEGAPPTATRNTADERIDATGCVVMPGLISTHQHVSDILLRGLGLGRDLRDWALNFYHPGTGALRPEDARVAVRLAMTEGLRAGITTLVDNWSAALDPVLAQECADAALEAYAETGVRVVFARQFSDTMPSSWEDALRVHGLESGDVLEKADVVIDGTESLVRRHHGAGSGRISVCLSPATAQTATPESVAAARGLAERLDTPLTIHHCETREEKHVRTAAGLDVPTTDYLDGLNALDARLLAAHCVWLEDRDVARLAERDVKVAHCPTSNLILASGFAPVARLREAGVTVALGCDNAMLNNNVALLPEARLAALLARGTTLDAGALDADAALRMATCDGAKAIGREHDLGVLAPGRLADLVVMERTGPHWVPCHDPANAMLFQSQAGDVRDVVVNGDIVLRDRRLSWLDSDEERDLRAEAEAQAGLILDRAGLWA